MPYKAKYKDLPEELKQKQREKSLRCWNRNKQNPEWMERKRIEQRLRNSIPEIREVRRLSQKEYYQRKSQDPEWRIHVGRLSKISRERKIAEQPEFRERERRICREWANTVNGKAVHLLKHARKRTQKNGHGIEISKEWLIAKLEKGTCEATGIPFRKEAGKRGPYTATLDRKDNSKGYTEENTQVVIWAFNRAKGEWSEGVLIHWIKEYLAWNNSIQT